MCPIKSKINLSAHLKFIHMMACYQFVLTLTHMPCLGWFLQLLTLMYHNLTTLCIQPGIQLMHVHTFNNTGIIWSRKWVDLFVQTTMLIDPAFVSTVFTHTVAIWLAKFLFRCVLLEVGYASILNEPLVEQATTVTMILPRF